MNTLLLVMLAATPDPLEKLDEVEVTGWSADETKFSVRAYDYSASLDGSGPDECPGYMDHKGKPFLAKLIVAAYDKGTLVQSWVVQDYPTCTPPAKAKATLTAAKAKFAELGIDLSAKGTRVECKKGCELGAHETTVVFEDATKTKRDEDEMVATFKGTFRVFLKNAKAKAQLLEKTVKESFNLAMGGSMSARVRPVEVSPQRNALVLRASLDLSNGRGSSTTIYWLGYYAWNGEAFEKSGVPKTYIPGPGSK